jgi:aconitate hydratase
MRDIWPSSREIHDTIIKNVSSDMFQSSYSSVFKGDEHWNSIDSPEGEMYTWDDASTYIRNPPYFEGMTADPPGIPKIRGARCLALLGDSITTDHISPAGSIAEKSPAGSYLKSKGIQKADFNSYGSRRGNHEVMMRGTFANVRLRNLLAPGTEGGWTQFQPSGEEMSIYDAAMKYQAEGTPLVVLAGKEYGTGSSRDWAAKGTILLGVKAVLTESFERIHRSNLIGMGILPLVFAEGMSWQSIELKGPETVTLQGLADIKPGQWIEADIAYGDGTKRAVPLRARIDTFDELDYFRNGGILHYVLRGLAREAA